MLERIREGSQGTLSKVILGAVILSFAAAGVGGYLSSAATPPAAKVNGEEISQVALERAYQNERSRIESQLGEAYADLAANPEYLSSVRRGVLDRLVAQQLLDQTARDLGLRLGDDQLKTAIRDMEVFQRDGVFDNDRYLAVLRQAGLRPSDFRDQLRVDMAREQLINALVGSEFSLSNEAERLSMLQAQLRDIEVINVSTERFADQVEISDEQITAYFEANQDRFLAPEQVSLEYIELTVDELMADIAVDSADAQAWYEANRSQYMRDERRRASHILFALEDKEKAERILKAVKAGVDFAQMAKLHSIDTFSGEQGGDLSWFDRGVMVPEFEQAAFSMQDGEISELVETQFGYHIIKLTGVEEEAVRDFSEVESDIVAELQRQQAQNQFAELSQQLADISFEIPDTLIEAAAAVGKEVQVTPLMARNAMAAPFNQSSVQRAAMSEQVLVDGLNSDLITLNDDHVLVVRLNEYQPSMPQTQQDVEPQIRSLLTQQAAADKARELAEQLQTSWQQGEELSTQLADNELSIEAFNQLSRNSRDVSAQVIQEAFGMPRPAADAEQASVRLVTQADDSVSIVRLVAVHQAEQQPGEAELSQLSTALQGQNSEVAYQALLEALREQSTVRYSAQ